MGSNVVQTGFAVVGATIGAYVGGPTGALYGYQIGMTIGSLVDPTVIKNQGPKLGDATVQYSSYGAVSPLIFGTYRCAGNVIWMSQGRNIPVKTRSGKGGPVQETETFLRKIDCAIRITGCEIVDILQIFADQKLVYDIGDGTDINTIVASGGFAESVSVYRGTLDQLPDPLIEAAKGVGNTPAYRGRSYIVFESIDVTNTGGRLPTFTFTVAKAGTPGIPSIVVNEVPGGLGDGPRIVATSSEVTLVPSSDAELVRLVSIDGLTVTEVPREVQWTGANYPATLGGSGILAIAPPGKAPWYAQYLYSSSSGIYTLPPVFGVYDGLSWGSGATITDWTAWLDVDVLWAAIPDAAQQHLLLAASTAGGAGEGRWALVRLTDTGFDILREGTYPASWGGFAELLNGAIGSQWIGGGSNWSCGMIEEDLNHFWTFGTSGNPGFRCFEISQPEMGFITYLAAGTAFARSTIYAKAGVAYVVENDTNYLVATRFTPTAAANETLQAVVEQICDAAGYEPDELDASTAVSETVEGYMIGVPSTARAAIEQLQVVYAFDMVERGDQLVVVMRGGEVEATIAYDELGASLEQSDIQERVQSTRLQEDQLPVEFNFGFSLKEFDYQPSMAKDSRQYVASRQIVNVSVPIAMSSTKGQEVATKNLFNAYQSRETRVCRTTNKHAAIDPGTIIEVQDKDVTYRGRVVATSYDQGILEITFTDDAAAIWTQTKPGETPPPSQTIAPLVPSTVLATFDLPTLRDSDTDWALYAGAAGLGVGWTGANLYRSHDDGQTFVSDVPISNQATLGVAMMAMPQASTVNTLDPSSYVDVSVIAGEFTSCTHTQLLNGANAIAIGNEVCQFRDAIDIGTNKVRLTPLYRGLRGTEFWGNQTALVTAPDSYRVGKGWYAQQGGVDALGHFPGEMVMLLEPALVARLPADASESRTSFIERALSIGAPAGSGRDVTHRHRGKGRLHYPPSVLHGYIDDGDAVLSWHRRSRIDTGWRDGADVPMDGRSERYLVQLNDGPTVTVIDDEDVTIQAAQLATLGVSLPLTFRVAMVPDDGESAIDIYDLDPEVWSPALTIDG